MGPARTGIAELDGVLTELVDPARDVLGDDLVGVYLQGSFALGGADDESDCDFLVVTAAPVDDSRLTALRAFHGDLPHRPGHWNQHPEGSYPVAADLADLGALGRPWPYVDHGSDQVVLDGHCNTEVMRWTLHECGVTVHGPSPRTLLGPIPVETMRAARAGPAPGRRGQGATPHLGRLVAAVCRGDDGAHAPHTGRRRRRVETRSGGLGARPAHHGVRPVRRPCHRRARSLSMAHPPPRTHVDGCPRQRRAPAGRDRRRLPLSR